MKLSSQVLDRLLEGTVKPAEDVDTAYADLRKAYSAYTHAEDEDLDDGLAQAVQQAIFKDLKWSDLQLARGDRSITCENDKNDGQFKLSIEFSGDVSVAALGVITYVDNAVVKAGSSDTITVNGNVSYASVKQLLNIR